MQHEAISIVGALEGSDRLNILRDRGLVPAWKTTFEDVERLQLFLFGLRNPDDVDAACEDIVRLSWWCKSLR